VRGGELERRAASPAPDGKVEAVDGALRASVAASEGTWALVADVRRQSPESAD